MDTVSKEKRSWIMSRIRSVDTGPERVVRSFLHGAGYRYALHARDLPGSPDLAMRSRRLVVEVRGCFWHHHEGCRAATIPHARHAWWFAKLRRNVARDERNVRALVDAGWKVLIVWECFLPRHGEDARERAREVLLSRTARLLRGRHPVDTLSAEDLRPRRGPRSRLP